MIEPTEDKVMEFPNVRMLQDNVLIELLPLPERSESGMVHIPRTAKNRIIAGRWARVHAVGPGYRLGKEGLGPLVSPEFGVGDEVLVDELAGQDWSFDNYEPRQNPKGCEWGKFRIIRFKEAHLARSATT